MRQLAGTLVAGLIFAVACAPPEVSPELRAQVPPAAPTTAAAAPTPTPELDASPAPTPAAQKPETRADAGWVTVRGERFDRVWSGHLGRDGALTGTVEWQIELEGMPTGRPIVDHDGTTYLTTTDPPQLYVVTPDGTATALELPNHRLAVVAVRDATVVVAANGLMVAIDTRTAEQTWTVPVGTFGGYAERYAHSRGVLYVASTEHVSAVALDVGIVLWTAKTGSGFGGDNAAVCLVEDEVVCVARGDELIGFDAASGEELWRTSSSFDLADTVIADQSFGTPTAVLSTIFAAGSDGGIVGIDPDDGTLLWETRASASGGSASTFFAFTQTDRTVVARAGENESWRRTLAGQTLASAPALTLHHVLTVSAVPSDRHEYAHDTVIEAFTQEGGEAAGSTFLEGAIDVFGLSPGPQFVAAVTRYADTAQEVPRHRLVAFS